jgi:hypothetical protein
MIVDDGLDAEDGGAASVPGLGPDDEQSKFDSTQRPWTRRERWSMFVSGLFRDHQVDTYSSLSPRKPDGTRTRLFFFNGNGQGR